MVTNRVAKRAVIVATNVLRHVRGTLNCSIKTKPGLRKNMFRRTLLQSPLLNLVTALVTKK
jgi:hypothetical protein